MKRTIRVLMCMSVLLPCAGSLLSGASPAPATASPDESIAVRIEHRVHADASLKEQDVKVSVENGVATLTGTVATAAQKARASRLARVKGITLVDNQIEIKAAASAPTKTVAAKAADKVDRAKDTAKDVGTATAQSAKAVGVATKETAGEVGATAKDSAKVVAEKTKEGLSKAGEEINDAWITARVKSKFHGDDLLKDSDIKVASVSHVVTLSGRVSSSAGRDRAIELAKATDGVSRVMDQLTIGN